jgi:hypothetical protein
MSRTAVAREEFVCYASEGKWTCNLYIKFITLSLTFHLGLDRAKYPFIVFLNQTFLCIFKYPVRFVVPSVPQSLSPPPTAI